MREFPARRKYVAAEFYHLLTLIRYKTGMGAAEEQSRRNAESFLHYLFPKCKELSDAHPSPITTGRPLRPPRVGKRSPYLLYRPYITGHNEFTLQSSGVSNSEAFAVIDVLGEALASQPSKWLVVDDMEKPVPLDDLSKRKNIGHVTATFPNKVSVVWRVTGGSIGISCPTLEIFNLLAEHFKATPSRAP